jgi:hypothetical protein
MKRKRKRRRRGPDYLRTLMGKARKLPPGGLYEVQVFHDSWCPLVNRRGPCRCRPHTTAFRRIAPGEG